MSNYSSDMNKTAVSPEQTGQESEREIDKTLAGQGSQAAAPGANPADSGNTAAALHTVTAGIRMGIPPLQFMDSIDAGGRQLGNRAFLHWVGQAQADRQEGETRGIAAQGLQGPGRPLTHLDTLQKAFGRHDIRGMREHTGPDTALALDALGAEGYTRSGRMAIAGSPDLYTQAHEAAHGVQQAALGDRMPLPNGIGVAGDRYERQADAVAQAVLRGESAQPLLDQVAAGPVQVNAAFAGATAPIQMRRRRNRRNNEPRQENVSGDDMPALEAAAQEMVNPVANPDLSSSADSSTETQLVEEVLENVSDQGMPALEAATQDTGSGFQWPASPDMSELQALLDVLDELATPPPAGGSMEIQQAGEFPENVSGQSMPASLAVSQEIHQVTGSQDGSEHAGSVSDIELIERVVESEASDSDAESVSDIEDEADGVKAKRLRRVKSLFPAVAFFHHHLTNRAEQVQTPEHGALSLPGIGNSLATVMLGLLMIVVGLPLDVFLNIILGGMAGGIRLLCYLCFGGSTSWLLERYFKSHPPSDADRARVKEQPKGPPKGIDWNVSIPELITMSAITGYFTAAGTQGSLSPQLWLQPWNAARISAIIIRIIVADLVYIGQFTASPEISRRLLQNMLGWGKTLSGLFISTLIVIFDNVLTYLTSYLTNPEVAVYLIFENLREEEGLTPAEATAAVIGYAAAGLLAQIISATILVHYVLKRSNEKTMIPWVRQFRSIPNRLLRTIVIALASFRNVIINMMTITLTLGQLAANIIGPLSTRFGEGGACFWPLAVAEVCGEALSEVDLQDRMNRIQDGEQNITFGQLFAIQIFPWLVGLLALGAPVGFVFAQYLRARRTRRGADGPVPDGRRSRRPASQDRHRLVEEGVKPGRSSNVGEGGESPHLYDVIPSQAGTMRRDRPAQANINPNPLNLPSNMGNKARLLCHIFSKTPNLTLPDVQRIIKDHLDKGLIEDNDEALIIVWARQNLFSVRPGQVPGESASMVIGAQHDPAPSENVHAGASPSQINQSVQDLIDQLSTIENDSSGEMRSILNEDVASGLITAGSTYHVGEDVEAPTPTSRTDLVSGTTSAVPGETQGPATWSELSSLETSETDFSTASPTGTSYTDVASGTASPAPGETQGPATWSELSSLETSETDFSNASPTGTSYTDVASGTASPAPGETQGPATWSELSSLETSETDFSNASPAGSSYTDVASGTASPAPGETQAAVTDREGSQQLSLSDHSGTSSTSSNSKVQELTEFVSGIPELTTAEMRFILNQHVSLEHITAEEADSIAKSVGQLLIPGTTSPVPGETQAGATGSVHSPELPVTVDSGASSAPMNQEAEDLLGLLLMMEHLTATQMQTILNDYVAARKITAQEAKTIARLVKDEVVLGK